MLKTIKESVKMEVQGKKVINNMQIETSQGTVYWQEEEPTNPVDGDTWFKVINGKAVNAYNRENGAWVEVEFSSQVIAEELIGKIITGAEINGAEINGTTINGGEIKAGRFLNNYTFKNTGGRIEGFIDIGDGLLSARNTYIDEPSEVTRQDVGISIQNGGLFSNNTVYDPDGTQTSYTGGALEGGTLQLSKIDGTGTYNGLLDAKLLESMSNIKTKTVNIPNNTNVTDVSVQYSRWGQFVVATFHFNLLKTDVIGLVPLTEGYRPINTNMGTGVLASIAGANRYCIVYAEAGYWRIIPGTQPVSSTGRMRGALVYLTNDSWQSAQVD